MEDFLLDRIQELANKYRNEFAVYSKFSEETREMYLQVAEELEQILEDAAAT